MPIEPWMIAAAKAIEAAQDGFSDLFHEKCSDAIEPRGDDETKEQWEVRRQRWLYERIAREIHEHYAKARPMFLVTPKAEPMDREKERRLLAALNNHRGDLIVAGSECSVQVVERWCLFLGVDGSASIIPVQRIEEAKAFLSAWSEWERAAIDAQYGGPNPGECPTHPEWFIHVGEAGLREQFTFAFPAIHGVPIHVPPEAEPRPLDHRLSGAERGGPEVQRPQQRAAGGDDVAAPDGQGV